MITHTHILKSSYACLFRADSTTTIVLHQFQTTWGPLYFKLIVFELNMQPRFSKFTSQMLIFRAMFVLYLAFCKCFSFVTLVVFYVWDFHSPPASFSLNCAYQFMKLRGSNFIQECFRILHFSMNRLPFLPCVKYAEWKITANHSIRICKVLSRLTELRLSPDARKLQAFNFILIQAINDLIIKWKYGNNI